jgi:hypothetical protein
MKYLKSYKIFESKKESEYREIIADLEDMSFDVQDLDVKVNIWSEKLEKRIVSTTPVPKSYYNAIQISIKELKRSAIEEVKYFISRAISFMPDWEVKMFGSKDFKVYDFLPDELEKYDFYEIYIRFYKPENTYHIVKYDYVDRGTPGSSRNWKIEEGDIESLEEAEKRLKILNDKLYNRILNSKLKIITDLEYWKALGNAKYFS